MPLDERGIGVRATVALEQEREDICIQQQSWHAALDSEVRISLLIHESDQVVCALILRPVGQRKCVNVRNDGDVTLRSQLIERAGGPECGGSIFQRYKCPSKRLR